MHRREFIKSGAMLCLSSMSMVLIGCDVKNKVSGVTAPYPSKPITMFVPFSAGSTADLVARSLEKFSVKYFGQPFITTNKPGGGGVLGFNEIIGANPDGYNIGIVSTTALLQPSYGPSRYHYPTALEPLVQLVSIPPALVVLSNSPWETLRDLVEYAKEHPGELKFAHSGLGTTLHIVGEMFAQIAGIKIGQVPFNGDAESLAALLGGHVPIIVSNLPTIREYVKQGNIRVLALSSLQRIADPVFKMVPTFKEQGYDILFDSWYGIAAPKMIPKDIKEQLDSRIIAIVNDLEFKTSLENVSLMMDYLGPDEFKKKWDAESVRLAKIVEDTGIAAKIAAQKN